MKTRKIQHISYSKKFIILFFALILSEFAIMLLFCDLRKVLHLGLAVTCTSNTFWVESLKKSAVDLVKQKKMLG
jgi:hypothetical protein